jgi:hypothetical protein
MGHRALDTYDDDYEEAEERRIDETATTTESFARAWGGIRRRSQRLLREIALDRHAPSARNAG